MVAIIGKIFAVKETVVGSYVRVELFPSEFCTPWLPYHRRAGVVTALPVVDDVVVVMIFPTGAEIYPFPSYADNISPQPETIFPASDIPIREDLSQYRTAQI